MRKANVSRTTFKIGPVGIEIHSRHRPLLDLASHWMDMFRVPPDMIAERPIKLTLIGYDTGRKLPFQIPAQAEITFENESVTYYRCRNLWIAEFNGTGILIVNRASLKMTGFVYHRKIIESTWHFEDFMHPLYELMRGQELYPHHAAAVSDDGYGFLLVGKSGRGKTSLSLDLIHNGFHFLADDRCFVYERGESLHMIGFYEPFKVFASNVAHIPALRDLQRASSTARSADKEPLDIRSHYPGSMQLTSEVNGLIFPCWSPDEKSRLEPLSPGQALVELLPLTLVCFDPASTKAHFEFSGRLVQRLPAARLVMGNDRENWHRLVRELKSHRGRR
jgi:hypothetical protein